jgi:hypothetical protein
MESHLVSPQSEKITLTQTLTGHQVFFCIQKLLVKQEFWDSPEWRDFVSYLIFAMALASLLFFLDAVFL